MDPIQIDVRPAIRKALLDYLFAEHKQCYATAWNAKYTNQSVVPRLAMDGYMESGSVLCRARRITLGDGNSISVQAGEYNYSLPRRTIEYNDDAPINYHEFELGFPTGIISAEMLRYAEDPKNPTQTIYSYVPIDVLIDYIIEHSTTGKPYVLAYTHQIENKQ